MTGTVAAGERFIQPVLDDGRRLDDLTGQGWRLFVRDDAMTGIVAARLPDGGAITAWLDARGVDAVLVRPDHYVFGTAIGDAADLLAARDTLLHKLEPVA